MLALEDLQLVRAISVKGTMAGAARELGLDYTTVFRRLNALEKSLGVRLFDRLKKACRPTLAGERLRRAAEDVQNSVDCALLEIAGEDARLTGTLRVTTTPSLSQWVLIPLVAEFHAAYPGVVVEVLESYAAYDLMHREAEIAIRFTRKPPENLVGTRIGETGSSVYASKEYRAAHSGKSLRELDWIVASQPGWTRDAEVDWVRANVPPERIVMRANTGPGVRRAAVAGLGATILIDYLGEDLVRLAPPIPELTEQLWLLTHPHLRNVARVRAFMNFMRPRLAERAARPAA